MILPGPLVLLTVTTDRDAPPTLVSDLGMSVADTTDRQATRAGVTVAAD